MCKKSQLSYGYPMVMVWVSYGYGMGILWYDHDCIPYLYLFYNH